MKLIDIVGHKFNSLTVLERSGVNSSGQVKWKCVCDCGKECITTGRDLKNNHTKSCGCHKIATLLNRSITHGKSKTTEFKIWQGIKDRCLNSNLKTYSYYGGRGVKICDRWINSFENFLYDMGERPSLNHSIDRFPNKNGNYEKSNCRWATKKEQANNTRRNRMLECGGEVKTLTEWAIQFKSGSGNILRMLRKKTFKDVYEYYMKKVK